MNKNQRMEGSFINKSLLTLGTVIHKLRCSAGSVCRAVQGQRGAGAVQDTYIARYCCSLSWGCQQRPVRPPRLMWQQPCVHVSAAGSDPCLSQLLPCSEGKAAHIPFRDSKLTRLLQGSLTGAPPSCPAWLARGAVGCLSWSTRSWGLLPVASRGSAEQEPMPRCWRC